MTEALRRKIFRRLRRMGAIPADLAQEMLSWSNSGFSLHAEVFVPAGDREGLERLLYYCAKPGLSPMRLSYLPKKNLVIYRTEPKNGQALALRFEPVEFLRRWGLLIPPPPAVSEVPQVPAGRNSLPPARKNLLRYYGALGPNSPLRALLVAETRRGAAKARLRKKAEGVAEAVSRSARSWAACLARVFEVDPLVCPRCAATMVPVAIIMKDSELVRLLSHLGLPTDFPKTGPARSNLVETMRGPPGEECQLDPTCPRRAAAA